VIGWLRRFEGRRLDAPRRPTRFAAHYDPDAFGRVSERLARFFGTARYLVFQTIIVIVWIILNVAAVSLRWDPYPFILLNLAFSTQAAYAAPLILLAQNRQAERDRVEAEDDRRMNARAVADAEFLARELMAARLSLGQIEAALARLEEAQEREREEREEQGDDAERARERAESA
jgi:uncharacterized membrane protein